MIDVRIACSGSVEVIGESPVWDDRTNCLLWVDILGRKIKRFDPATQILDVWDTLDFPTAVALSGDSERPIVAFASEVAWFDLRSSETERLATLSDEPEGNRLNEGAVSPCGAFWVGTMQTNFNPDGTMREMDRHSGALYRIDSNGVDERLTDHAYGISNTMAWDVDRGRFYFGDTLKQTIYLFDYDAASGEIANQRVFAHTPEYGFPDGSCLDEDGFLWNCRYAGGCLLRYAPNGRIDRKIDLPATNITACTFGGPDLGTLYVTTAANELREAVLQNPHEGALLALEVGVNGHQAAVFGSGG